jgi:N-acetyl-anhydromuramyl-L-alanine amidase AmpD
MNIQFVGCAASNTRKGRKTPYRPEAIVIHIMAGSLAGTDVWFNSAAAGVSAHYGVGRRGEVHQYVAEEDTAFHAGTVDRPDWSLLKPGVNPNHYTIGIEHEGQPTDQWTEAMRSASAELIAAIATRWSIPIDRAHIIKHHQIRFAKSCPGENAPIDDLIARAQALALPPPAAPPQVTALTNLKVRSGAPNTTAAIRRVAVAGSALAVAGFTAQGESVSGNPNWYRDANGDFFWAGGTDRPHPQA